MKDPVKNCKWAKYPIGDITQWFAENPDLYSSRGSTVAHNGVDIVRPHGEHLYACEAGTVTFVRDDPTGYGRTVRILSKQDAKGKMNDWVYGHLSRINVKEGQWVNAGQYIGDMGNTGFVVSNSTGNGYWDHNPYAGTHLHLGVRTVVHDADGFSYPGYKRKIRVLDYDNGYKGRWNPLPLFRDPALLSSKIISTASALGDKVLFQFGQLLRKIGY